jgi:hypothetical protein
MMEIRMTGLLYEEIKNDLARSHPFAGERVGFVFGKLGSLSNENKIVILTRYHSIPDDQYEEDDTVGARIGSEAMGAAMQAIFQGRAAREGIFHIHVHEHQGPTRMSGVDARGLPPMMPGFQSMGRSAAHGIIILSNNHGSGWIWPPSEPEPITADAVTVIGAPVRIFKREVVK